MRNRFLCGWRGGLWYICHAIIGSVMLSGVLYGSTSVNAYAPIVGPDYNFNLYDAVDNLTSNTNYSDWRNMNYAIFQIADSTDIGVNIWGDYDTNVYYSGTPGISEFGLIYICQFEDNGNAPWGCWADFSSVYASTNVYEVKLTDEWINQYKLIHGEQAEIPPRGGATIPIPDLTDDISVWHKVNDKEITLVHKTEIPPLDLSTMMCEWIVSKPDFGGNVIDKITSCNESNFQQVVVDEYGIYQVKLNILFDKNQDSVIVSGESIAELTFNVNVNGNPSEGMHGVGWEDLSGIDFEDCMKADFPFIDFPTCIKNMRYVGTLLSFNRFTFGTGWNFSNECRDLEVLGGWLNLRNKTVCPQIDSTIRATITPFVTFAFGLMAVAFVSQKTGGGFA